MKILMVSIFSPHFFNWTLQLKESSHEVYWLDVLDMETEVKKLEFVKQTVGWKRKYTYPGRYWIKQHLKELYFLIEKLNQREIADAFESLMDRIQPDVVQSFEMNSATIPILRSMEEKYPEVKWIYSAWGNDYYYSTIKDRQVVMQRVFSRINFLFTDCVRDSLVAKKLGFNGKYLGTFPGGGGYDLNELPPKLPIESREKILIKGYQKKFGRCIPVLEALAELKEEVQSFKIVVFGADEEVFQYVQTNRLPIDIEVKGRIGREKVLKLLGEAQLYIGNSLSDGMPNTLLEAFIMGAFPIHSNPGDATQEIITDQKNGILISNPEDKKEISMKILQALKNLEMVKEGVRYTDENITPSLERNLITKRVLSAYDLVERELNV